MLMQEHEQGNYEKDAHIFVGHSNIKILYMFSSLMFARLASAGDD